jgi:mono/diheme cytochrome c family protein
LPLAHAAALPEDAPLLPVSALPAYEQTLDHAGLIRGWNKASLARGEKIYQLVCHACHGDLNLAGSIPNALRFAEGKFSHGADPHTLYETLTRGWRLMAPQVQLVPREKYDVIHYLRETFLKDQNPSQYVAVTDAYLAGLPRGNTTGPAPVKREPWRDMDYGQFLIGTFELADASRRAAAAKLPGNALDTLTPEANVAYQGHRDPARTRRGRHRGRTRVDRLRTRHAAAGRRLDGKWLHRLGGHQLQRPPRRASAHGGRPAVRDGRRARLGQSGHG